MVSLDTEEQQRNDSTTRKLSEGSYNRRTCLERVQCRHFRQKSQQSSPHTWDDHSDEIHERSGELCFVLEQLCAKCSSCHQGKIQERTGKRNTLRY